MPAPLLRRVIAAAIAMVAIALPTGSTPAVAVPTAATPDPSNAVTWSLVPSTEAGPDGRISIRQTVEAGSVVDDHVTVTNFSEREAEFLLYASDGIITAEGTFDLMAPGVPPSDGGSWITVGAPDGATVRADGAVQLPVAPGASVTLPVRIRVPAQATPGDHPAGVVAQLADLGGSAVQVASRVGVRVHLRVAGDVVARLEPTGVQATWHASWNPFAPGTVRVRYTLDNTGNVRLGATTEVSLAGPMRLAPTTAGGEQREILPGQVATTSAELAVWPLFRAWGSVSVTPIVVGEDEVDAQLSPGVASLTVWAIPWSQLVLLVVLIGAVLLARSARRRRRRRTQALIDAAVAEATAALTASSPPQDRQG